MDIVALKIICRNLSNFEKGSLEIDLITEKRVYGQEVDDGIVDNLFGSIYKLNVIALTGINATGKTTILNILSELLRIYVGNGSLDYGMRFSGYFKNELEVDTYYYHRGEHCIFKLTSSIQKNDAKEEMIFAAEKLYRKKVTAQMSRENLFDFSSADLIVDRHDVSSGYLKNEDSIFSIVMNKYREANKFVQDMHRTTNHNIISKISVNLMIPFVQYLDPSIEYFGVKEMHESSGRLVFELKFKQNANPIFVEYRDLEMYLSSGTIKGISCLSTIAGAFETGGYVFIDEIENHLNKTIVVNIINLFTGDLNKKKATLLFSTHYSEILDPIDRSDGIYLLDKSQRISVQKFSIAADKLDRKDRKRSDLVLSGMLNSAPSYKAYKALVESLNSHLWGKDSENEN